MRSLGYVENRDVRFEYRFGDGYLDSWHKADEN